MTWPGHDWTGVGTVTYEGGNEDGQPANQRPPVPPRRPTPPAAGPQPTLPAYPQQPPGDGPALHALLSFTGYYEREVPSEILLALVD
ncbi:hypothetical protein ABZ377_23990, partial [Streptomyces sp. NPDC005970]